MSAPRQGLKRERFAEPLGKDRSFAFDHGPDFTETLGPGERLAETHIPYDAGSVESPILDHERIDQRAERRLKELEQRGEKISLEAVKDEIANRDKLDSSRATSPLKKAADARELDTSNLSIQDQVLTIHGWVRELLDGKNN